jgi:hypothetical protein
MTPDTEEWIATMVRAGYLTASEIVDSVVDAGEDDDLPAEDQLTAIVEAMMQHRRQELAHGGRSSYERLRRAFEKMQENGLLARENYWCCQTCALSAISAEIEEGIERGEPLRGYVLFHSQDTDCAVEDGVLFLRYGGVTTEPARTAPMAAKEIGGEIVALLRRADFRPEWSGSPEDVIHLPIEWDKRPPADTARQ